MPTPEHKRLLEIRDDIAGWRRWGPYVSDRSWATVREDYSSDGNAWDFLPHEMARSKAYRWGEDAIAGWCDRYQLLVFAPVFWNGRDRMLKERLFGLTPHEGNHGEDVKECYFHLDGTPTHSYMKFLYKYPHRAFPYEELVTENLTRAGVGPEFELLDTGVFDEDRYFDIFIEYAKISPEDTLIRIEAINRGSEPAALHLLPHLWFRNTWGWTGKRQPQPVIGRGPSGPDWLSLHSDDSVLETMSYLPVHYRLGPRTLYGPAGGSLWFTDNETNSERVFGAGFASASAHVKDAFHRTLIQGENCLNPAQRGTKAAFHYAWPAVPPGGSVVLRLRLSDQGNLADPLAEVDAVVQQRREEADDFYEELHPREATAEERQIQRQALAGLLWTKQSYVFDVAKWLDGDNPDWPPPASRQKIRNWHWRHLNSMRVMSVPDKWEYPWFAAWDLAFHCLPMALVDPAFAKDQLWMLLFEQFQHPNGQLPAYEWEFCDLNPPVHAWAVWRVYQIDRQRTGKTDRDFLEKCFHKLLLNFTWWVNRADRDGLNLFEGGFLGLDNISLVDRSKPWPAGYVLDQADATGWMGMFCLNMMRIALELAQERRTYEGLAAKFFQHYTYITSAMKHIGGRDFQLWDERDGFFYDVLRGPDGAWHRFRVRSVVGLIPLFAVDSLDMKELEPLTDFTSCVRWFLANRPHFARDVVHTLEENGRTTHVLTVLNRQQLGRILRRVWDPAEFLAPNGVRSLSHAHAAAPFIFQDSSVDYEPAEAVSKIKGGNSNWRGPIWFPTCMMLVESLRNLGKALGPSFSPWAESGVPDSPLGKALWGPGKSLSLLDLAGDLAERLIGLFQRDKTGRRPLHGQSPRYQNDPHWRDLLLFYEYFNGDTGEGLGASHQTGWTALVASLIDEWR